VVANNLASNNVVWLIQIPRLYNVYRDQGIIENFAQVLAFCVNKGSVNKHVVGAVSACCIGGGSAVCGVVRKVLVLHQIMHHMVSGSA
jgi:adenosine deaminase